MHRPATLGDSDGDDASQLSQLPAAADGGAPPATLAAALSAMLDELRCPLCAMTLAAPVATPCGHVFCAPCLGRRLDAKPGPRLAARALLLGDPAALAHAVPRAGFAYAPFQDARQRAVALAARRRGRASDAGGAEDGCDGTPRGDANETAGGGGGGVQLTTELAPRASAQTVFNVARPREIDAPHSAAADAWVRAMARAPAYFAPFSLATLAVDPMRRLRALARSQRSATRSDGVSAWAAFCSRSRHPADFDNASTARVVSDDDGGDARNTVHSSNADGALELATATAGGRRRRRLRENVCPVCDATVNRDTLVAMPPVAAYIEALRASLAALHAAEPADDAAIAACGSAVLAGASVDMSDDSARARPASDADVQLTQPLPPTAARLTTGPRLRRPRRSFSARQHARSEKAAVEATQRIATDAPSHRAPAATPALTQRLAPPPALALGDGDAESEADIIPCLVRRPRPTSA
jgi:hypothetical protein